MAGEYILTAFGLNALRTKIYRGAIGEQAPTGSSGEFTKIEGEVVEHFNTEADDTQKLSWLGTPVFSDLVIKESETGNGMYFDTILFDVSLAKNIVKTSIQGRKGTVKEYISDGDYVLSIRGGIVNHGSNNYPTQDVGFFIELMQLPQALFVVSPLLQLFDVQSIVVENYKLIQRPGFQNIQFFEIDAISDEPLESFITNSQL